MQHLAKGSSIDSLPRLKSVDLKSKKNDIQMKNIIQGENLNQIKRYDLKTNEQNANIKISVWMSVRTEKGFFNMHLFLFVVWRFIYDCCFWEENLWNDLNHFSLSVAGLEWFWEWNNNSWTTHGLRTSFRPFLFFSFIIFLSISISF